MRSLRARPPTSTLACVALVTAATLAACGSSVGLIPADSAITLHNDLSNIEVAFQTQNCSAAVGYLATAQADLANIPATVDQRLAKKLHDRLQKPPPAQD